jgi:exopolysaccharide production protein ExoQ
MSFAIALGLSIAFSMFVLWQDGRGTSDRSWEIWLPTVWFMLAIAKPLSYWVSPGSFSQARLELDYSFGSPIDRLVLTFLMAAGMLVMLRRRVNWSELFRRNGMLFLVLAYMAVSILWSDYKAVALKRYLRSIGDVVMALIIVTDRNPTGAVKRMIGNAAFILLPLSIVMIKYFRILGVAYTWDGREMWVGVTSQKNSLGILCGITATFFVGEIIGSWRDRIPVMKRAIQVLFAFLGVHLLLGSRSATSLGAFLVGTALVVVSYALKNRERQIDKFYVILAVGAIVLYFTMLERIVGAFGRDMTFTSRDVIWNELLQLGSRHPLVGIGYASVWIGQLGGELWSKLGVNEAHNGYIEIYVQLGLVGLTLVAFMLAQSVANIRKKGEADFHSGVLSMAYLFMIIITNITESSLLRSTDMLWILCLCISILPPRSLLESARRRQLRTAEDVL